MQSRKFGNTKPPQNESPFVQHYEKGTSFPPPSGNYLLLTDGTNLLLTDGTNLSLAGN